MAKGGKEKAKAPASIQNRKARFDYAISDEVEAGIALQGSEVKSIYLGKAHLNDAYCRVVNGEMYLLNMDVEPYEQASVFAHERRRDRKLLMHRREIDQLHRKVMEKGFTLIPLGVYFNDKGRVKVKVGLGRGKANYDKRDSIAKDDARREADRVRSKNLRDL
ncbi:SsrA-binding protein SmpB [bacterium]|nr:MAG: SsrA-binding protein SmpB [bacterium]